MYRKFCVEIKYGYRFIFNMENRECFVAYQDISNNCDSSIFVIKKRIINNILSKFTGYFYTIESFNTILYALEVNKEDKKLFRDLIEKLYKEMDCIMHC